MKKVIVTGADGFIGSRVVLNLLRDGCEVWGVGLVDNGSRINNSKYHFIKAIFEDYVYLDTKLPHFADCFFHFAWDGIHGESFKDYEKQLNNAKYCCDAFLLSVKINCKKFVLASTINVLESMNYMTRNEIKPRYANVYAMSKLTAEMMCKTLAFQNNSFFCCGLIPTIYGEGNYSQTIINKLLENLLYNKETNLIAYDDMFDMVYVEDAANAFIEIGKKGKNLKTYYVGHSKPQKIGDIVEKIKKIVNPNGVVNYNAYVLHNGIDFSLLDMSSLLDETSFSPSFDFELSIKNTIEWIKNGKKKW